MQRSKPDHRQRLADVAKAIPRSCYEKPTWRGLATFAADLTLYAAALFLLATTTSPLATILGWILASTAISGLFVLGHDAAHGALFRSSRLNYVVGQLAMLPSLHAFSVWAYGHNRIHHAFTCCRDLDFVWHPTTPEEFAQYPPWRKALHRIEWSRFGAGLYYARAMWLGMIFLANPPDEQRAAFVRDRAIVIAFGVAFITVCAGLGWQREATAGSAAWAVFELFLVPWMLWNTIIGWTVYIHHIHPDVPWYARRNWTKFRGQIEGTTNYRMPRPIELLWHNIYDHTAHHLDPRIPFYHLRAATDALRDEQGWLQKDVRYRVRDYLTATRTCKLFDFERGRWVDYAGRPAGQTR